MANLLLTQYNISSIVSTEMTEVLKINAESFIKIIKLYNLIEKCKMLSVIEYRQLIEGKVAIIIIIMIGRSHFKPIHEYHLYRLKKQCFENEKHFIDLRKAINNYNEFNKE